MKNGLVKSLNRVGLVGALAVASLGGGVYLGKCLDAQDPIGKAKLGYVTVRPGDTIRGLYIDGEGWTSEEMAASGIKNQSSQIFPGDVLRIPQKEGNPYNELGSTGRVVYKSREAAEAAQ